MIRSHVVLAVLKRNFVSYFSSPTGYVFIAVFVMLAAATALGPDAFWTSNLANLQQLNEWFPYLLLFFIPAVAMGVWSEERKLGTEELLLTLPVRDLELVVGKFLAAQGVYTVALLFSLTNVVWLFVLGSPDLGMILGNYLAYWFLGAALLSLAMVASLLTGSMTVAFILGAVFCAVPVFLSRSGAFVGGRPEAWLRALGTEEFFKDFASGVLSLSGLAYFLFFTAVMLYVNLILLGRRHVRAPHTWGHLCSRAASLAVIGVCVGILSARTGASADITAEQIHRLARGTYELIDRVKPERPVLIQAYISPEVPQSYVGTRETLLSLLKDFDAYGRERIHLKVYETEPHSREARDAEDKFGIKPVRVREADRESEELFLGVVFSCGLEETVVPFLYKGLSVEYELARSIGVVTGLKRKKIGVAATDAKVFGGMDFQTFRSTPEWRILTELKKQYEVVQVSLDGPVAEKPDALLVVMPSSLTQAQMDNLLAYIKTGSPTLLFDDPSPMWNPPLAASEPNKPSAGQRNMFAPPPPSEPKGNIVKFLETVGLSWTPDAVVFDLFNPHPRHRELPVEFVFAHARSGAREPFQSKDPITSGLQEMVLLFSGHVEPRLNVPVTFTPLLTTSPQSGALSYGDVWEKGFFGAPSFNMDRPHRLTGREYVLAARVQGKLPEGGEVNLFFCADADCIGDQFFFINEQSDPDLEFDNVTFVLNAVDILAGDTSFVDIRKRRARHRTLEAIDRRSKDHQKKLEEETKAAEEKARQKLKEAQDRLDGEVRKLEERKDIDERRMEAEVDRIRRVEQARLDAAKKTIEDEKKATIRRSQEDLKQAVRRIQREIKGLAVALAPVPALLIALAVFLRRQSAQRRSA